VTAEAEIKPEARELGVSELRHHFRPEFLNRIDIVVPSLVAGAALTAFSGALLGLYLRTPGMHEEGSLLPTPQGTMPLS
jgi:hypothetical protein